MRRRSLGQIISVLCSGLWASTAPAAMQSSNFSIHQSVLGGGGGAMSATSGNLNTTSTLGQPSPLMDPADPPISASFDLYPGFWYALNAAGGGGCLGDLNNDGAVDGADLGLFALDFGSGSCGGCAGDLDGDDDADGTDLRTLAARFGVCP